MLYLVKSGKYVKIGYAKDVSKRMKAYSCTNPDYQLLDTSEGNLKMETFLHKILKPYQYRTEWFYNVPEIYDIWNDYKQTIIDYKSIPTILSLDEIKVLNSFYDFLNEDKDNIIISLNTENLSKIKKKSGIKWSNFDIVIKEFYIKKWLLPFKGDIKLLDINNINNYLQNDPFIFDKNELRLFAYKINYVDSN